ncbi:hypothetical protein [Parerythrobacter lacustris]|uniref:DUF1963 domain-containing protein n=1 Tax=Parerythrobacter lacustris TaxID=2969984 RepID=A0ABT1XTR3_9SPHN|nr:hypothetical protein [Parerythrobacter lacustris]MCR2834592.1 hypothetical protein [Parerythrobacter lacustris]
MDWLKRLFGGSHAAPILPIPSESDGDRLKAITARVFANGNPEARAVPTPLLSLEEFFEGNDDIGSIGCNLDGSPPPSQFYALFQEILDRPEVSDVRVQVTCVDSPGEEWPFSDTIWIMTTADETTVRSWFPDELMPNDCWIGWIDGQKYETINVDPGHHPVAVWYD